jgi:hypothetical protein
MDGVSLSTREQTYKHYLRILKLANAEPLVFEFDSYIYPTVVKSNFSTTKQTYTVDVHMSKVTCQDLGAPLAPEQFKLLLDQKIYDANWARCESGVLHISFDSVHRIHHDVKPIVYFNRSYYVRNKQMWNLPFKLLPVLKLQQ